MTAPEERMQILRMVSEGKLTAEEAADLMTELDQTQTGGATRSASSHLGEGKARWLRIYVTDGRSGKNNINLRIPLSVAKTGLKVAGRYSPQLEGLDMAELARLFDEGERGPIVDVADDDGNQKVQIYLE